MDSALQVGGAAGIGRLMALLGNLSAGQEALYADIFDELDPEALTAPSLTQFVTAREFGQQLFGCDLTLKGSDRTCIWGRVESPALSAAAIAVTARSSSPAGCSCAAASTSRSVTTSRSPRRSATTNSASFASTMAGRLATATGSTAASAWRELFGTAGAGSASLTLSAGSQTNDLSRSQTIFVTGEGRSHFTTSYVQVAADLGYSFGLGELFVRSELDGSMTGLKQHRFTEQGLAGLGMTAGSDTDWIGTLSPHLTLGADLSRTARIHSPAARCSTTRARSTIRSASSGPTRRRIRRSSRRASTRARSWPARTWQSLVAAA